MSGTWLHLLTLAGDRIAVWQSPTRRYFLEWAAGGEDLRIHTDDGFSRLPDAIRAAAEREVGYRQPVLVRATGKAIRNVLWETQCTPSCVNADARVQAAVNQVITSLRGVR